MTSVCKLKVAKFCNNCEHFNECFFPSSSSSVDNSKVILSGIEVSNEYQQEIVACLMYEGQFVFGDFQNVMDRVWANNLQEVGLISMFDGVMKLINYTHES